MCFMVQSSELYIKDVVCANHTTPREAAKTRDGRERLEALFVDFHQKNIWLFSLSSGSPMRKFRTPADLETIFEKESLF